MFCRARSQRASQRHGAARQMRWRRWKSATVRTLSGLNVIAHRRGVALHLLQTMFNDVADGYDADKTALINNRKMAEFPCRHPLHEACDCFTLGAGRHLSR